MQTASEEVSMIAPVLDSSPYQTPATSLGLSLTPGSTASPPCSPNIQLMGAAQFAKHACCQGNIFGQISYMPTYSILSAVPVDTSASTYEDQQHKICTSLPEPYWDFAPIFDPIEVNTLPPQHPYDMKIELETGKSPLFGPIYSLTQDESTLADYTDKNLIKGLIHCSTSSVASPILFVKCKSGKLHLCVNYYGLNTITKYNHYPLPLISNLLDWVNGCKIFSKINLKNEFNLICIAEGNKWKTAFHTNLSLFEYLVMLFGLTNALLNKNCKSLGVLRSAAWDLLYSMSLWSIRSPLVS
ncbi:hypothetical protein OPQ81_010677 [Rhizoctonia solani]|nr:hypothetical protein OPQ81_010677 [Rhizoctonia solani]